MRITFLKFLVGLFSASEERERDGGVVVKLGYCGRVHESLVVIEKELNGKEFLLGEKLYACDLLVGSVLNWARGFESSLKCQQ